MRWVVCGRRKRAVLHKHTRRGGGDCMSVTGAVTGRELLWCCGEAGMGSAAGQQQAPIGCRVTGPAALYSPQCHVECRSSKSAAARPAQQLVDAHSLASDVAGAAVRPGAVLGCRRASVQASSAATCGSSSSSRQRAAVAAAAAAAGPLQALCAHGAAGGECCCCRACQRGAPAAAGFDAACRLRLLARTGPPAARAAR